MAPRLRAALAALLLVARVDGQSGCTCPDGSTPDFAAGSPPCTGGPPVGAECPPPPDGGGPPGGGAPPGGDTPGGNTPACSGNPCPASLLGDVGLTTVTGTDQRTSKSFPVGENIYGPFEAGFTSQQDNILAGLGCDPGAPHFDASRPLAC